MIAYLHGFNSSPDSHKARLMGEFMAAQGRREEFVCPRLPVSAKVAITQVEAAMERWAKPISFVGSSLGGFYATWLVEKHADCKAVLLNPAIDPHVGLRACLGPQKNLYTGEPYELTEQHLREWQQHYVPRVTPSRYLLIVETGDEVLDHARAVQRYAGAQQIVVPGGDHSLRSFPGHLPRILEFCRAPAV